MGKHATCFVAFTLVSGHFAHISKHFQNILVYIPLQQAWAYWHHYFGKSFASL